MSRKSHTSYDFSAGNLERMRSSRHVADENPCLVDFMGSEGVINLSASVVLESMRLRSWQSLVDAGPHPVRKPRNSTASRSDRPGTVANHSPKSCTNSAQTDATRSGRIIVAAPGPNKSIDFADGIGGVTDGMKPN